MPADFAVQAASAPKVKAMPTAPVGGPSPEPTPQALPARQPDDWRRLSALASAVTAVGKDIVRRLGRGGYDCHPAGDPEAVGKAALQPIYARAHDAAATSDARLSLGLPAVLMSLQSLLPTIQPKMVPYIDDEAPAALIDTPMAGHIPGTRGGHDWGYVVQIGAQVFYDCGTAPYGARRLPRPLCGEIYVLEIQVLAPVTLARRRARRSRRKEV